MKCQYEGIWTRAGCNEDALPDSDFCHAHQRQGQTAKVRNILVVVFIVLIGGSCGMCAVAGLLS